MAEQDLGDSSPDGAGLPLDPRPDRDEPLLDMGCDEADVEPDSAPAAREPMLLCRVVARRPRLAFGVALGVHLSFLALSVALVLAGYDLFPFDFDHIPLALKDRPWYKRDLAWKHRNDYSGFVLHHRKGAVDRKPRTNRDYKSPILIYDAGSDNLLTRDNLLLMQKMENRLANVTGYSKVCQLTEVGTCFPTLSLLRFFDGTLTILDPAFYDPDFRNVTGVIHRAYTLNATRSLLAFALPKEFTITASRLHVPRTRSILPLGNGPPFSTFTSFMVARWQPLMDEFLNTEQFEFLYFSELLMIRDGMAQAFVDMRLTGGSLLFIFAFIYFHTRSLWVTGLGGLSIVCSFVETNLVYRVIIGFRYFSLFHVLAMFIILGIGADDLFVFWDAWRTTGLRRFPSLAHRLDAAYRQSAVSMLVTSLTTAMAFAVSALSPLLIVNSFGVFSAVLVAIDYVSVITFFPTIVVVYHVTWERRGCCCCCLSPCCRCHPDHKAVALKVNDDGVTSEGLEEGAAGDGPGVTPRPVDQERLRSKQGDSDGSRSRHSDVERSRPGHDDLGRSKSRSDDSERSRSVPGSGDGRGPVLFPSDHNSAEDGNGEHVELPEHRWLVKFFSDYHFRFMTHRVVRWVALVVLLAVVGGFVFSATRLQPDNQQIGLFKESHHHARAYRLTTHGFLPNPLEPSVSVWILWGLQEQDLSHCHFSDYRCPGRSSWDPRFNPSTWPAQRAMKEFCATLRSLSMEEYHDMRITLDLVSGKPHIKCFMDDMEEYLKVDPALSGMDVSFPWNQRQLTTFVTALSPTFNLSHVINSSFPHVLDVPVNYWLWDGFRPSAAQKESFYDSVLGEQMTPFSARLDSDPAITVGNRIKYLPIHVMTDMQFETLSYTEHLPVMNRWENFMQSQLSKMPPEIQGFQIADVAWNLVAVQQNLVHNAWQGVILGIVIAAFILVLATGNVINGLLATFTIVCVTACVIGVVPLMGWRMGILVSLNMCLVVGLSVDYVVHLAEGYHLSSANSRRGRLRQSLGKLGISVFSGACTTLGASAFMLLAQIKFFFEFGIFMFCTIGFSVVFAFCFYVPLMGILGPEGEFGDIRAIYRACVARMRCRKSDPRPEMTNMLRRRNSDEDLLIP